MLGALNVEQDVAELKEGGLVERLGEDVGSHQFTVGTVHVNVMHLELVMQPCDRDAMRAADVHHVGILPAPTNSAARIVVLKHHKSDLAEVTLQQVFPKIKSRKPEALQTMVRAHELTFSR